MWVREGFERVCRDAESRARKGSQSGDVVNQALMLGLSKRITELIRCRVKGSRACSR